MGKSRLRVLGSMGKGLAIGIVFTLACMAALAAATVFLKVSDGLLTALNQLVKAAAIVLACAAAIGRGGPRGFVTGMALAILYMTLGYGCYAALGGPFAVPDLLGEILVGAAIGAVTGAVLSNLPARRRGRVAA